MELKSILPKTAPRSQALIRVYDSHCRLNAAAARILDLKDGDSVDIFYDKQQLDAGRTRIYIGKSVSGVATGIDGRCRIINSRPLSQRLIKIFGRQGSYRICPEDFVVFNDSKFFNIFFKPYDKENTAKGHQPQSL